MNTFPKKSPRLFFDLNAKIITSKSFQSLSWTLSNGYALQLATSQGQLVIWGAAKACLPAHLAAHQLPSFCITITTGQAEAIWQSRKKDYECPYFNPSPLRDCWLKCLFFSTFAHCMNFKRRGYICEQWKEKLKKKITLVHNIIFCWYHLPTEMFVLEPLLWSHKITNIKSSIIRSWFLCPFHSWRWWVDTDFEIYDLAYHF